MRLLLLASVFFAACSGKPVDAPAPTPAANVTPDAAAKPAEDADCNLQTPLVPGIPGSPGHLIKSARNPNGDSELAVLMRKFVDDLREVRTRIEAGEKPQPLFPTHRKMRCSWPTKPDERNERFDLRAQGYLAAVRAFDGDPSKTNYNNIINGCVNCHAQSCGGPLDFIDGMRWQ